MNLIRKNTDFFPAFFDDFFGKESFGNDVNWGTTPAVNILENENNFTVELAAPGMRKEDFHVSLDDQTLTISYEKKDEQEDRDKEGRYTRREFNFRSFKRSFMLPKIVEKDKIEASYEDGLLQLRIPKSEDAYTRLTRKIDIK